MAITDAELDAIIDWLDGIYEEDSAEDIEGRRAIARVLREEPYPAVLVRLANLIDPDARDVQRQWLVFKRARGRSKTVNGRQVAAIVWERIKAGDKREAAYGQAADVLGISKSAAEKALAEWEDFFDANAERLKGLTRTTQ